MANSIPLSDRTRFRRTEHRMAYHFFFVISTLIGMCASMYYVHPVSLPGWIGMLALGMVPTGTWWLLLRRRYNRILNVIYAANEEDYRKSTKLKEKLQAIKEKQIDKLGAMENPLDGTWKPFRVEHFLSNSLKGYFPDSIPVNLSFSEKMCHAKPSEILDSCSILFLTGGNETRRILIPSPRTVKDFYSNMLDFLYITSDWHTHCAEVLGEFKKQEMMEFSFGANPKLLDSLDESCNKPLEERPDIRIKGCELQGGIILATSIDVNGKETTLFPTRYFDLIASGVSGVIKKDEEASV